MHTIYGITNCDATQKLIKLLQKKQAAFRFHDYKQSGISKQQLEKWIAVAGLEKIFNKRSTTWKTLTAGEQQKAATPEGAIAIMLQHNSIIKRPVLEAGDRLVVGFSEKEINELLSS